MCIRDIVVGASAGFMVAFVLTMILVAGLNLSGWHAAVVAASLNFLGVIAGAMYGAGEL